MSSEWLLNTYICVNSLTFFPLRVGGTSLSLLLESELVLLTHCNKYNSPEMMLRLQGGVRRGRTASARFSWDAGSPEASSAVLLLRSPCLRYPCHVERPRVGAQATVQLSQSFSGTSPGTRIGARSF